MKAINSLLLTICMLCSCTYYATAQSGTVAAGGDASGTGGSVSSTIGIVDYINYSAISGMITEGIQQPYEIYALGSSVFEGVRSSNINLKASVHPNPATDYILLDIGNISLQDMSYTLSDINGKVISTKSIVDNQTKIPMKKLGSATYFLNVLMGNNKVKSFKIIKN